MCIVYIEGNGSTVDMCGVERKRRTLGSKRHGFEPTSRHKTYTQCAVGQ